MKQLLLSIIGVVGLSYAHAGQIQLGMELNGLEPMKGQHYEGWNIVGGQPFSTGRFSIGQNKGIFQVDASGQKQMKIGQDGEATFMVDKSQMNADLFVLTIEPNNDTDAGPSNIHIMGGDYSNQKAGLTIDHKSSIGSDFLASTGSFILAAPTGGTPNQGVWFLDPAKGQGSLDLPALPDGWAYEGWIVNTKNGAKLSTGLFKETSGADSDGAGPKAGPLKLSFPPAPGQDIVSTPVVLDDGIHAIVISVEPYPDFDPAPYALKVFKADVAQGAPGMTPMPLSNIATTAPTGTVHIH